ncbi:hypothetical protein IEN85_18720 [Pelagicoccus sp. NFK12]|uniref:Uncharacterized protein n=1 Tax=Pelagicoccus enzymogenes TaxID=2773457 RepID=A0A927IGU3_9BACT|nr:hypothetical protein [Pelagicoccus enzymogenes]MBD5781542.1 hypothetical protein [Pelagicoccus enzymogenes]
MIRLLTCFTLILAAFSMGCARDIENRLFYNLPENKKITIITNPEFELIGIKFENKESGKSRTAYLHDPIQLKENGYAMRGLEHRLYVGGSPARYEEKELPYVSTRILTLHGISEDYVDLNTFLADSNSYSDVFKN